MKNVENDLKKDGITVVKPLDTLTITLIAKFVAEKLTTSLMFFGLKQDELFISISRVPMYVAKMPDGMSEANYLYKNSSIYFKEGLSLEEMQVYAVHEFIHCYQELKDKNNVLYRLGLCDFTNFKTYGMALNEAAVQYIASKALKNEIDTVKYYGIEMPTISPVCYPIICNLISQMAYITGEQVLIDSTLNSNDNFKNSFMNLCGEKTFYVVQNNFDIILNSEEKIIKNTAKLQGKENLSESTISKYSHQIIKHKQNIQNTFIKTQNLILTSYFNNRFENIYSNTDVEDFRMKLYNYKDYIGITDNYSYFNDYYINMMTKLMTKCDAINSNVYMQPYKNSVLRNVINKLLKLLGKSQVELN